MTGKEWVFSTKSVIPVSFPPSFQLKLRNKHGGQKPPELCEKIIRTFTKEGNRVLDPFCGVGGTLLGCHLSKRQGVGIEINKKWIEIYKSVCQIENIKPLKIINGDSRQILKKMDEKKDIKFDFILTDVPYWNMDMVKKSKGRYKKVGEPATIVYSDKSKLSAFNDSKNSYEIVKDDWELLIKDVFTECFKLLKPSCYCAVFIGNMYHNGQYHLLNADISRILCKIGFFLKGEVIWYDVAKKLHLYGINYSWIPSLVHQFIMIFRKERTSKISRQEVEKIKNENIKRIKQQQEPKLAKHKGILKYINTKI